MARLVAVTVMIGLALAFPAATSARQWSGWGMATLETGINSAQADGCPIETPDGLALYFASARPGAVGGPGDPNDIWVAVRSSIEAPWSAAVWIAPPPSPGPASGSSAGT